jgi:hypothetical protein
MPRNYAPAAASAASPQKRKTAGASPMKRSLRLLREEGFTVAIAEHWNAHARRRVDLFGFADLVAVRADQAGALAVQATTSSNASARLRKALAIPALRIWLASRNRFEVWSWKRNRQSGHWTVNRESVTLDDVGS